MKYSLLLCLVASYLALNKAETAPSSVSAIDESSSKVRAKRSPFAFSFTPDSPQPAAAASVVEQEFNALDASASSDSNLEKRGAHKQEEDVQIARAFKVDPHQQQQGKAFAVNLHQQQQGKAFAVNSHQQKQGKSLQGHHQQQQHGKSTHKQQQQSRRTGGRRRHRNRHEPSSSSSSSSSSESDSRENRRRSHRGRQRGRVVFFDGPVKVYRKSDDPNDYYMDDAAAFGKGFQPDK